MSEASGIHSPTTAGVIRAKGQPTDARLWKAAQDFQEVFLGQFVQTMRTTQKDEDGLFEECPGRDTFDSMFSQAIGKQMAQDPAFGLRDVIYRQMGGKYIPATSGAYAAGAYKSDATAPVSHKTPAVR